MAEKALIGKGVFRQHFRKHWCRYCFGMFWERQARDVDLANTLCPPAVTALLTAVIRLDLGRKRATTHTEPKKVVDATYRLGNGTMREEVWQDSAGKVVRYNLAFVDHRKCQKDNGRVLGYDSAHGYHHRHWMGTVEAIEFSGYEVLVTRFCEEVAALCKKGKA